MKARSVDGVVQSLSTRSLWVHKLHNYTNQCVPAWQLVTQIHYCYNVRVLGLLLSENVRFHVRVTICYGYTMCVHGDS